MHATTPVSAAFVILSSGVSAYLLSRHTGLPPGKAVRLLAALVLWEAIQLVPVQILATLQLLGAMKRVSVPAIAAAQAAVLVSTAIWCFARKCPPSDSEPGVSGDEAVPRYLLLTIAVLLCSYLAFAVSALTGFPAGSDAVIYHLPLALRWLQDGSLGIPASGSWQYSMPGNAEIGMMVLLSSGKQSVVVMVSWIAAVALTVSTYLLALWMSKGNRLAAITACLIVLSVPMIEFQVFSAYVDLLGTAGVLAAFALVASVWEGRSHVGRSEAKSSGGESSDGERSGNNSAELAPAICFVAGLACGISLGTKQVYYFYAAVFCAFMACMFWVKRRFGAKALLKSAGLVLLGMSLPSIFWFARAWSLTGNPVYPIQMKVGARVLFAGYEPSQITARDFEFNFIRDKTEWLVYPWTEWKRSPGYLKVPYGEGEGFGAAFATFVPLGVLFLVVRTCFLKEYSPRNWILLFSFGALVLSWWVLMERLLRFGQAVWVFACVLSVPFVVTLQARRRRSFAALLLSSVIVTSAICTSVPLHILAGRVRKHLWSRSQSYNYPAFIDQLPAGTVVLNASGIKEKNFPLAGKHLTNRVIASFEAPPELTPESVRASGADYVLEVVPGGQYPESSLVRSCGSVVDDELVATGESKVRWRIWKVEKDRGGLAHRRDLLHVSTNSNTHLNP